MNTRKSSWVAACVCVGLIAGGMLMGGCGSSAGPAKKSPMAHVTLWLDWTPWGVHVPIYAAAAEGYFRKRGLDVSIRVPSDVTDPLKLVAAGSNTLGIGYMSDVVTAESSGVPVESVAALVQHHLNCIMTLKSSGIRSPKQLVGKSVGQGGTPADKVILDTVFKHAGVSGKVHLVNLNYPYVPALLHKRVDAIEGAYQVWEKIQMEQQGYKVNVIQLQKWGVPDEYELVLLSGRSMISSHPATIRKFMYALDQGEKFAVDNPKKAVNDFLAANPADAQGRQLVRKSWRLLIPFMTTADEPYGWQNPARWSHLARWMFKNRLVGKRIPNHDLFSDKFLS